MEKLRISVVTVVRDDLEGLRKTRKSLETQNYENWLHIIVDGDSTDGTKEYLELLPSYNTMYVSEPDTGIYNAMNKGWKLADRESFIIYMNARDVFASDDSLRNANLALEDGNSLWGCTTHEEINPDGSGWVCKLVSPPSPENQLYAFGYRSHQGVVMKQELIAKIGGFDETYQIAADWELIVNAIRLQSPAVWNYPLGRFELGGMSSGRLLEAHMELRQIRRLQLTRTPYMRLLDDVWCAIYLEVFGYSNYITSIRRYFKLILKFRTSLIAWNSKLKRKIRELPIGLRSPIFLRYPESKNIQRRRRTRGKVNSLINIWQRDHFLFYLLNKLNIKGYDSHINYQNREKL